MSIYWITRLDEILVFCIVAAILLGIACIICFIESVSEYNEEERKRVRKPVWYMLPFFVVFMLAGIFVPSTKQACAIYVVDYLQQNEDAQQLPDKMLKAANAYFDEMATKHEKTKKQYD